MPDATPGPEHDLVGPSAVLRPRARRRLLRPRDRREIAVDGDELVATSSDGRRARLPLTGPERVTSIAFRIDVTRAVQLTRESAARLVLVRETAEVAAHAQAQRRGDDFSWPSADVRGFARAAGVAYEVHAAGPRSESDTLPSITAQSFAMDRRGVSAPLVNAVIVLVLLAVLAFLVWLLPVWVAIGLGAAMLSALLTWTMVSVRRSGRG